MKVIAIDFDGCICTDAWPEIGEPIWSVIDRARQEQLHGAKLILWTCRCGDALDAAVDACRNWGLHFDAVNNNLPELVERYGGDPRKVSATEYWDDRAVQKPMRVGTMLIDINDLSRRLKVTAKNLEINYYYHDAMELRSIAGVLQTEEMMT